MSRTNYFENLTFQGGKKINVSDRIDAKFSNALHWHQYAELLLSRCDGNEVTVDFSTHRMKMNDVIFVCAGSLHSIRYVTEESFLVIQFPAELLTQMNELKPVVAALSRMPLVAYVPDQVEHNEIISGLSRIRVLYDSAEPFREVSMYAQLLKTFRQIGLLQSMAAGANPPVSEKTDTKNMTLIAEAFFCDPKIHIVDVAYDSGFASISSFNRAFRRIKGCSPTQFRRTRVD